MKNITSFLVIASIFLSFGWIALKDFQVVNIDPASISSGINFSDLVEDIEIIPLETNEDILLSEIRQVKEYKNTFIVVDPFSSQKVLAFDQKGKFKFQVGRKGQGPGEFSIPQDICISEDVLYLLDGQQGRINMYNPANGSFMNTKQLPHTCSHFVKTSNHFYLYTAGDPRYNMFQTDNNLKNIVPYLPKLNIRYLSLFAPFTQVREGEYYFRRFANDTITSISDQGLAAKKRISFGNHSINNQTIIDLPQKLKREIGYGIRDKVTHLHAYCENRNTIYCSFAYNQSLKHALYDKSSGKTIVFDTRQSFNDLTCGKFPYIFFSPGFDKDYFLGYFHLESTNINDLQTLRPELKGKINQIANPALVKVKFKTKF